MAPLASADHLGRLTVGHERSLGLARQHHDTGCQHRNRGAGRQLQGTSGYLQTVEDALLSHIDIRSGAHVESDPAAEALRVVQRDRGVNESMIVDDLLEWSFQRVQEEIDAMLFTGHGAMLAHGLDGR